MTSPAPEYLSLKDYSNDDHNEKEEEVTFSSFRKQSKKKEKKNKKEEPKIKENEDIETEQGNDEESTENKTETDTNVIENGQQVDVETVEANLNAKKKRINFGGRTDKYLRQVPKPTKKKIIKDKKLKNKINASHKISMLAAKSAAKSEIFLPEEPGYLAPEGELEKTNRVSQLEIQKAVDVQTQKKIFDLSLDTLGPYMFDYTRNGKYLLLGGRKGHISLLDWKSKNLTCEIQVKETITDVKFLQNETLYAVAQKKYVFIYDKKGVQIHCLKSHVKPNRLEFLPYHFLLASVGDGGWLKYQDVSTGQLICELRTKLGRCDSMRQNPRNAILGLGHHNGVVTMWSPNLTEPTVKMLCHKGDVRGLAFDLSGNYMVTTGMDNLLKIWDLRTYKMLHKNQLYTTASAIDVSQTGLISLSLGANVQIWKDAFGGNPRESYMSHSIAGGSVSDVHFCPYEDVLGISGSFGFSSIVIPGSGEPNIDTFVANPYENKKQRQESEVHALLEKIPADMITMDPDFVAKVNVAPVEIVKQSQKVEMIANNKDVKPEGSEKKKKRKKKRAKRRAQIEKTKNIIDEKREKNEMEKEKKRKQKEEEEKNEDKSVLDRFKRRKV